jgi:hypothetical protein
LRNAMKHGESVALLESCTTLCIISHLHQNACTIAELQIAKEDRILTLNDSDKVYALERDGKCLLKLHLPNHRKANKTRACN